MKPVAKSSSDSVRHIRSNIVVKDTKSARRKHDKSSKLKSKPSTIIEHQQQLELEQMSSNKQLQDSGATANELLARVASLSAVANKQQSLNTIKKRSNKAPIHATDMDLDVDVELNKLNYNSSMSNLSLNNKQLEEYGSRPMSTEERQAAICMSSSSIPAVDDFASRSSKDLSTTSIGSVNNNTDDDGSYSDDRNNHQRLRWSKKMDFLLSIIGFAVDMANIWRFPYLCYKNGGGVFLIPYITMLIFGGFPLFFLELLLGQYVKKGPITVWNKISPQMKGVGYCCILISWYVSFYYNILIAWSVYFIYRAIMSLNTTMPWEDCDNSWNSPGDACMSIKKLHEMCSFNDDTSGVSGVNLAKNVTVESLEACRRRLFSSNITISSPAQEFFVKELTQLDQVDFTSSYSMGVLRPELVLCTIVVYLLHYCSLFRGLETSGKVVWVTATAPYMILSILLVRGLFLPGAARGISYYLSPKLDKLADPIVWIDAASQVFYSIGVGFGVHLTYASFNSHHNNCYRDCLMTSAINAFTSVYSGLVVFVYLGYMSTNLGIEIDKVASEGYSLVFEVYPEALTTLPFSRFWTILFFIMMLTLGIDSAMGGLEAVITGLEDEFKLAKRLTRGQLTGIVIFSSFLPSLISCTQAGAYSLFWFDTYAAGTSLLFAAFFETIGVVYIYGLEKFIKNIESMLGRKPNIFYVLCWKYISPLVLSVIIFMSMYTSSEPIYRGFKFPTWTIVLGWSFAFSSVVAVPIFAIYYYIRKFTGRSNDVKPIRKRPLQVVKCHHSQVKLMQSNKGTLTLFVDNNNDDVIDDDDNDKKSLNSSKTTNVSGVGTSNHEASRL